MEKSSGTKIILDPVVGPSTSEEELSSSGILNLSDTVGSESSHSSVIAGSALAIIRQKKKGNLDFLNDILGKDWAHESDDESMDSVDVELGDDLFQDSEPAISNNQTHTPEPVETKSNLTKVQRKENYKLACKLIEEITPQELGRRYPETSYKSYNGNIEQYYKEELGGDVKLTKTEDGDCGAKFVSCKGEKVRVLKPVEYPSALLKIKSVKDDLIGLVDECENNPEKIKERLKEELDIIIANNLQKFSSSILEAGHNEGAVYELSSAYGVKSPEISLVRTADGKIFIDQPYIANFGSVRSFLIKAPYFKGNLSAAEARRGMIMDAEVMNVDRNAENVIVGEDFSLILIDNSLALQDVKDPREQEYTAVKNHCAGAIDPGLLDGELTKEEKDLFSSLDITPQLNEAIRKGYVVEGSGKHRQLLERQKRRQTLAKIPGLSFKKFRMGIISKNVFETLMIDSSIDRSKLINPMMMDNGKFRTYKARLQKSVAATKIQAVTRGYLTKKRYKNQQKPKLS